MSKKLFLTFSLALLANQTFINQNVQAYSSAEILEITFERIKSSIQKNPSVGTVPVENLVEATLESIKLYLEKQEEDFISKKNILKDSQLLKQTIGRLDLKLFIKKKQNEIKNQKTIELEKKLEHLKELSSLKSSLAGFCWPHSEKLEKLLKELFFQNFINIKSNLIFVSKKGA